MSKKNIEALLDLEAPLNNIWFITAYTSFFITKTKEIKIRSCIGILDQEITVQNEIYGLDFILFQLM